MRTFTILIAAALVGCKFEETALEHKDLEGKVRIPAEALSVDLIDSDGNEWTVEGDPRILGPVYLGVYASIQDGLYAYPHPELGPVLEENTEPNAYPYGGTTVGRFDWGCYEALVCKMVTGRYSSYDDVLDFFQNDVRTPVLDPDGAEVGSGIEYQERCYEVGYYTDDAEVSFLDDGETDFSKNGDYWEADVTIPHALFAEGVNLWGWVDMPSRTFDFSSCDPNQGQQVYYYDENYLAGAVQSQILNTPGVFIDEGDWVAEGVELTNADDEFVIELGIKNVE